MRKFSVGSLPFFVAAVVAFSTFVALSQSSRRYRIAVVPMTNTHAFFQTIKAGAEKAAKELGVQIL
ncbi:MAG: hypothetical protein ACUVRR_13115, partial [Candidatus Fervidibacter sp.]